MLTPSTWLSAATHLIPRITTLLLLRILHTGLPNVLLMSSASTRRWFNNFLMSTCLIATAQNRYIMYDMIYVLHSGSCNENLSCAIAIRTEVIIARTSEARLLESLLIDRRRAFICSLKLSSKFDIPLRQNSCRLKFLKKIKFEIRNEKI
jgi:hypothetical protein